MRIIAGIVLYNPDLSRLEENINTILPQVDRVVLVDNFSLNHKAIFEKYNKNQKLDFIWNDKNFGIAKALNQIMDFAYKKGYEWVLTLDQDSVCEKELVQVYEKYCSLQNAGIITCNIIDRNFSIKKNDNREYHTVKYCISSASFMNVKAFRKTNGFDEKLFIDGVDFDICIQIRKAGFFIYKVNYNGVLHEVGHGKNVKIFGKTYQAYNHSPIRQYYMARNSFYLLKKYKDEYTMFQTIKTEIRFWLTIILYEKDKIKKIKARVNGILDSRKM